MSYTQVPPNSTGNKIDTLTVLDGVDTVHRQVVSLGGLADQDLGTQLKDLTETVAILLSAILEKLPRVTATDQAAVSVETGTVAVSTVTGVTTVSTVSSVTNQTQIGGQEALSAARAQMMAGTQHIYSNIVVS